MSRLGRNGSHLLHATTGDLRIATRLPISVGKVPVRPQAVTEKLAVEVLGQQNQKQNVTIVVVNSPNVDTVPISVGIELLIGLLSIHSSKITGIDAMKVMLEVMNVLSTYNLSSFGNVTSSTGNGVSYMFPPISNSVS